MSSWRNELSEFFARLSTFRRIEPIRSAEEHCDFLAKRAAFVSQKKLYEYVKTRMGLSYPKHFADDLFIESLNLAKWRVYAACLSDLSIWMAGVLYQHGARQEEAAEIALRSFNYVVDKRFTDTDANSLAEIRDDFDKRLSLLNWNHVSEKDNAFTLSPVELVRWAPIDDKLKRYDEEIVENSIRFAWVQIRTDFRKACELNRTLDDWRSYFARPA